MSDGHSDSYSSSMVLRRPQKGRLAALRDEPSKVCSLRLHLPLQYCTYLCRIAFAVPDSCNRFLQLPACTSGLSVGELEEVSMDKVCLLPHFCAQLATTSLSTLVAEGTSSFFNHKSLQMNFTAVGAEPCKAVPIFKFDSYCERTPAHCHGVGGLLRNMLHP